MNQYQAVLELGEAEKRFSEELIDLINKLIQQNPEDRLGAMGIAEIKQHSWLQHFPWTRLELKQIVAPFRPYVPEPDAAAVPLLQVRRTGDQEEQRGREYQVQPQRHQRPKDPRYSRLTSHL